MIASNSVLGLTEIRAVRATRDMIETGVINPNVRAGGCRKPIVNYFRSLAVMEYCML